jgi:hypothetical protein
MSFTIESTAEFERVSQFKVGQLVEVLGTGQTYRITAMNETTITLQKARWGDRAKERLRLAWITCRERFWEWWYRDNQGEPREP